MQMEEFDNIRQAIDKLLSVKSAIKRKSKTKEVQARELFITIINSLEMLNNRATILYNDLKLDFSTYDESFLEIIDALMFMKFGEEACEVISFYLWERQNLDGSINELQDAEGNVVPLENATDLWNVIQKITSEKK